MPTKYAYVKYLYLFFGSILAICLYGGLSYQLHVTSMSLLPLPNDSPCTASLNISRESALAKVKSYAFPEAQKYLKDLFSSHTKRSGTSTLPAFLTGSSSNHFKESLVMIQNINSVVRRKNSNITFIYYDLGLKKKERKTIQRLCNCEVRDFPFQNYPRHVKYLNGYAWKPIAIQLIAREHQQVVWMDASIRFHTSDLEPFFKQVREQGVVVTGNGPPISRHAHYNMFKSFNETPCTYSTVGEIYGTFVAFYISDFVSEYVLKPWVSCALSYGCMVPDSKYKDYRYCLQSKKIYFTCHRFDQAALGILFYRLFYHNIHEHKISYDLFEICRDNCE